jgi:hypothetical protein
MPLPPPIEPVAIALIDMNVEMIRSGEMVRSMLPEPDPSWRLIDEAGHGHFATADPAEPYPTLRWISDGCADPSHGPDCGGAGHYECPLCEQSISPKTRAAADRWIPGPFSYRLTLIRHEGSREERTLWEISAENFRGLQGAVADTIDTYLSDFRPIERETSF